MIVLKAKQILSNEECDNLAGVMLTEQHCKTIVGGREAVEPVRIEKEDGELIAIYLPKVLNDRNTYNAWKVLRTLDSESSNRGTATGKGLMKNRILQDGSESKTHEVPKRYAPKSSIIGYFDRYPRIPYCRKTAFNLNHGHKFDKVMPFVQEIDKLFKEYVPDKYEAQLNKVKETQADWIISGTAFTTITVNKNWQTAVHKDAGDLKEGFGVMTVLRAGEYSRGMTVYPKYGIGFDVHKTDLLLWNVHEWHGNVPIIGKIGKYERISCVFYFREDMIKCGTVEQELERAKNFGARGVKEKL